MATPITVPRLGWNMEQGVFLGWLKADGAPVRTGDSLFTLEGEKAAEDIECFENGILHIPADSPKNGDVVPVGAVVGYVLQPGEPPPVAPPQAAPQAAPEVAPQVPAAAPTGASKVPAETAKHSAPTRLASSPRARRAAANLGLDWKAATGSGRNGRIRERDVLSLASTTSPAATPSASDATRRVIAERMLSSHRNTAPVTLTTTIDATNLVRARERRRADAAAVPSYLDWFVVAAARALAHHPALNSRWENGRIAVQTGIHIGIAVDTDAGLLVPVVRDVPKLGLDEVASRTRGLIDRARQRKLAASEMQGGTFTVTSLGGLGIDAFTPILNEPECAILGIGRIRRCPVVSGDQIVVGDQVTLSLTFDHRIVDGAPAARFLQTLASLIENPAFA